MGNYTIFLMFENPRRGRQARNLTENDPKILDLKSSSEQIIFRKLSLGAPVAVFALSLPAYTLFQKWWQVVNSFVFITIGPDCLLSRLKFF